MLHPESLTENGLKGRRSSDFGHLLEQRVPGLCAQFDRESDRVFNAMRIGGPNRRVSTPAFLSMRSMAVVVTVT
jgi:hypothetical protein